MGILAGLGAVRVVVPTPVDLRIVYLDREELELEYPINMYLRLLVHEENKP